MRLALLSNVTVDLLASMVKKNHEVYLSAGFDTWQQEMLLPTSGLYRYRPEAVVVLLHAGAFEWPAAGSRIIDEWCEVFSVLTDKLPNVPVFVSSIDISLGCHFGADQRIEPYLENYLTERIEQLHCGGSSIYILPVKDCITEMGRNTFYSPKMWYVGSMPYSMKGLAVLKDLIARYVSVAGGRRKKCLAVDLDNTLWGGVIGEDGVDGIVLSNHQEGARYYDAQKILKKMKDQGVMLAVLSKNNAEDIEPVYTHPYMVLQHEDFVAEVINWEAKSVNIRNLAEELNIGLDSFVFLDDNPAEREQMMSECPEVTVIDFPKDSSLLPEILAKVYDEYFLSLEVTGEDSKKTEMYRAESRRKAELNNGMSVGTFLKKLEMTMDIHFMKPGEEKRVVQLVNKTNQFNVTTKRYSEKEIHEMEGDIITVHMSDKYGDQGLVAVLILKYDNYTDRRRDGDTAVVDTFLMSCRVMGRSAENEIMARIKGMLMDKGVKYVKASYVKTAKNSPVADLFDRLGFNFVSGTGTEKRYEAETDRIPDTTGMFTVMEDWT